MAENSSAAEDTDLLRKQIGTARTVLLIVAVATLISAMLLLPNLPGSAVLENIILTGIISIIYFLLALYTKKKPYTAILAGLAPAPAGYYPRYLLEPIRPIQPLADKDPDPLPSCSRFRR